ncbi:MAG TPA: I78 family peptidase inhibitor, partial [Allosphingosinicella sp.]|nr:I78 family peptidase inhibitor [Allosphingosinicella sp.]
GAARVVNPVGRARSDSLVAEVARRSGARRVRWIRPGDAVTMDYSAERLNVHLDEQGRILRFACG